MKLTAAILAAWVAYEGFSAAPYIPTKGDVPTIGHGATQYENGTRVTLSDPAVSRARAGELALNLLERQYAPCVRRSLGEALVNTTEFEIAVDFAGQYGCAAWGASPMVRHTKAGEYVLACQSYLNYRFMTDNRARTGWVQYQSNPARWKFDCATPGNKTCKGVWTRQLDRYTSCMSVQSA